MAGVLGRGGCGNTVANPSHELHDVFEDVRFGDLTMWSDNMRKNAHLRFPVGDGSAGRLLVAGKLESLSV